MMVSMLREIGVGVRVCFFIVNICRSAGRSYFHDDGFLIALVVAREPR